MTFVAKMVTCMSYHIFQETLALIMRSTSYCKEILNWKDTSNLATTLYSLRSFLIVALTKKYQDL